MKRVVIGVVLLLASPPAFGQEGEGPAEGPFSLYGGRLLGNGENAISAGLGWPGLFFEWDDGLSSSFNLGVRGEVLYGSPTSSPGALLGTSFGLLASVPMRLSLSESRSVGIALGLRPGFYVGTFGGGRGARFGESDVNIGVLLEAGLLLTITASSSVNVVAGVTVPTFVLLLLDAAETELFLPLVPFIGVEVALADDLNLVVLGRFGPALHLRGPGSSVEATFGVLAGIEYRL